MKAPCELVFWTGLPVVRKELAESLTQRHGLNQKETAEILGLTPAAISQYLSEKRGKIRIVDKKILKEIDVSAERIIETGETRVVTEICRICRIFRTSGVFQFSSEECECQD